MARMELFAALALLALAAAAFVWRRGLRRRRARYIERYPFYKLLDERLAARRPELNAAQRQLVCSGLREYFQLCRLAHGKAVAMPSRAVLDAWHEFILHTRRYRTFCGKAFGHYLDHAPRTEIDTPARLQEGVKRTWRLSCLCEGINPKTPRNLPLLFSIDGMLGICDGFHYRPECLSGGREAMVGEAAGEPAGSFFCARHQACGGACCGSLAACAQAHAA